MDLFDELFGTPFGENPFWKTPFDNLGIENPFEKNIPEWTFAEKIDIINNLEKGFIEKNKSKIENILERGLFMFPSNRVILKESLIAYLKIGRNDLAYKLSEALSPSQARAILEYSQGDFSKAIFSFSNSKELTPNMKILYSLSYYNFLKENNQDQDIKIHFTILNSLIGSHDKANSILGVVDFDNNRYNESEIYFERAKIKNPSEMNYLNLFNTKYVLGKVKEIDSEIEAFYENTNSNLNQKQLELKFKRGVVKMPKVKINNLYQIISKLLR